MLKIDAIAKSNEGQQLVGQIRIGRIEKLADHGDTYTYNYGVWPQGRDIPTHRGTVKHRYAAGWIALLTTVLNDIALEESKP